jgi:pimeloyl-ACP methyl ester carboxylesterase
MNRRRFIGMTGGAFVAGAAAGCATRLAGDIAPASGGVAMDAAAFHAARRFAKTEFGDIAYVERGTGAAAVFLHGFPLNGFQWRGALDRLAPYRRCIAPDFLAMGYTEVAKTQDVGPDAQVAMLIALFDTLSISTADVVANDSGGAVAQLLVTRHPQRVRTLLLTNCDAENDSPPPALKPVIDLSKQGKFVDEWLGSWRADPALARSAAGIGGMCYTDPSHPTDEAIEIYFAPLLSSPRRKALAHAYAIALERNPLIGIGPALKRSTVPTKIVWGTGDTIFSPASPDALDRAFGNSRGVRRLASRKLFWPEELPDVVTEEARRLWRIT